VRQKLPTGDPKELIGLHFADRRFKTEAKGSNANILKLFYFLSQHQRTEGGKPVKKQLFLLVALAIFISSAAYAAVQTDYDHSVVFSQYHTYSWGQVQAKDSLWSDRVRQGVDQQLQAKGWRLVSSDADVVILALADSRNQQEEQTFYSGGGWRWGGVATTSSYTTRQGVLVISIFDAKTKKLVWRGTATGGLSDNPDKNVGKLNKAVSKMFDKFPPK
jgi:hypothetical protein